MYPDPMIPLLEKVRAYEEAIKEIKDLAGAGNLGDGLNLYSDILEVINELEKKLS
jgi:hypothetical protein